WSAPRRSLTSARRPEQSLREGEDRFRLVADTAPVMIWMAGAAAASLCKEVSAQQQVTIEFRDEGIPDDVTKDVALGLYRVLQEGISNAVKHAGVGHVTVTLRGCRDEIELEIVDAGSGFNPTAALTAGGLGLISMQERLSLVN